MTGRDTQAGSNLVIHINKVVDVEKVGPPVVLTVVSVRQSAWPERPLPPVAHQTHVDHDTHHVHWCQPETTHTLRS